METSRAQNIEYYYLGKYSTGTRKPGIWVFWKYQLDECLGVPSKCPLFVLILCFIIPLLLGRNMPGKLDYYILIRHLSDVVSLHWILGHWGVSLFITVLALRRPTWAPGLDTELYSKHGENPLEILGVLYFHRSLLSPLLLFDLGIPGHLPSNSLNCSFDSVRWLALRGCSPSSAAA